MWYAALPRSQSILSAKGSVAIGLLILERLRTVFDFSIEAHLAAGNAQIRGASKARLTKILARYGESRPFLGEAGRTNRSSPANARNLPQSLGESDLVELAESERLDCLTVLQKLLVQKLQAFHDLERLKPAFDPSSSTRTFIRDLLALAAQTRKRGPVAQHLVGAKLEMRFPTIAVRIEPVSAADDPSGQPGGFVVGDTTFHVTVAPMTGHYEKCLRNLRDGRRVYLLVPDDMVIGARQNLELSAPGRVAVESIESFVAQNIEELSEFNRHRLCGGVRQLLETYNRRVDQAELDKSLLIEIPGNL